MNGLNLQLDGWGGPQWFSKATFKIKASSAQNADRVFIRRKKISRPLLDLSGSNFLLGSFPSSPLPLEKIAFSLLGQYPEQDLHPVSSYKQIQFEFVWTNSFKTIQFDFFQKQFIQKIQKFELIRIKIQKIQNTQTCCVFVGRLRKPNS